MNDEELKNILEAILMNASEPLSLDTMQLAFEDWCRPTTDNLKRALRILDEDYKSRAIELKQLASGYALQTRAEYSVYISRLQADKPAKYSRALLETLAIIAYRQPVTRADIEDIRGVAVSSPMLKTLMEREWIKVAGFRDVPGKPAVFATTKTFLDYFNLGSLNDLPPLEAIDSIGNLNLQSLEEYVE